jgi:Xaa-Pro dipeptidase
MEVQQVRSLGWDQELIGYDDVQNPWALLKTAIQRRVNKERLRIAVEKEALSLERAEQLQVLFEQVQFCSATDRVQELRLIKDEQEISILKEAAELADYGVEIGIKALKEGITELEVVAQIEYELKKQGVTAMSFGTMVLFGENSALPHGKPGTRRLKPGDLVLFDLGVVVKGYCSDITRTVAFRQVSDQQKEIYEVVKEAQAKALSLCRPNVPISQLDQTARDWIRQAGYGEYFLHRLGHGLGISVHEFPSLHERNDQPLFPGMVFTVEPGIYLPKVGGVRIEDDVVITDNGADLLTKFTKELLVV